MKRLRSTQPRRRVVLALVAGLVVIAGVPASAIAAGSGGPSHARPPSADTTDASPMISGDMKGGGCRAGYDTRTDTNIPPDDSTSDNVPANSVTLTKSCAGAVLATFTSEVSTPTASDFIHLDLRATCIGTGGFTSPCTVGQQVFASPGHSFVQNGPTAFGTRSIVMAWTALPRGIWVFDVLPGGNNVANLQFRALTVEAFRGG